MHGEEPAMAGKKVRNEIDGIRAELRTLSEAVWALRDKVTFHNAAAAAVANPNHPKRKSAAGESEPQGAGTVISRGAVVDEVTGREIRWTFDGSIEEVLAIDDESTARVLAAVGHRQRLAILKRILASPSTVADLVADLELGTTGAAYHHLNVLQAANLATQATRGVLASRRTGRRRWSRFSPGSARRRKPVWSRPTPPRQPRSMNRRTTRKRLPRARRRRRLDPERLHAGCHPERNGTARPARQGVERRDLIARAIAFHPWKRAPFA
jgi:hypothetical protein